MMKSKLMYVLLTVCLVAACGKSKKKSGATAVPPATPAPTAPATPAPAPATPAPVAPTADTSLSYRYTDAANNCDTGQQTYTTLQSMCQGLVNESLNNNCARTQRLSFYTTRCQATYGAPTQSTYTSGNGYTYYSYPSSNGYSCSSCGSCSYY